LFRNLNRHLTVLIASAGLVVGNGCAIHYYDPKTGTEHVWGIGHMKMKLAAENEGLQAVIRGTDTLGFSVGSAPDQNYFSIGWQRLQALNVVAKETVVRIEWPNSDFVNVRIGSQFPTTPQPKDLK
jgi:hypothetical protein